MKKPLKCLVIEDEYTAFEILERFISDMPETLSLGHHCETVNAAIEALQSTHYDLIFLDLRLPGGSGLKLFTEARKNALALPPIIFTSAHPDQILQSFQYQFENIKQLPKPVSFETFKQVVLEFIKIQPPEAPSVSASEKAEFLDIYCTEKGRRIHQRIWFKDIRFVKAEGGGCAFCIGKSSFAHANKPLSEVEKDLTTDFVRIHKSHIVNMTFYSAFDKAEQQIRLTTGENLDVGENYLKVFILK